ncbi:response regulator transcription factor [Nocardioides agariphilus]|jgi:DNA-binding NarL/FixJ family response regulator|uniref:Response regulator transcription factor n=2 Tax=Nocardioides agariphilus TaxID=433664 RepID=A0A930VJ60_9ACTN|nr:response regulator transcription factor [Nocardioides agariphilus]
MNDYEIVVVGLQTMLAPYADRVRVVELDSLLPVHSNVDVLLFDAFGRERVTGPVEQTINETDAKVVIYTWHLEPELVKHALAKGAVGCVSKTLDPLDLVGAIEKVSAGSIVVSDTDPAEAMAAEIEHGGWPGREHGLSARESEVLALIAQGLSNQEIADRAFLSINSVKTYIRSAYRKIGVERRTQAVLWATRNGFVPSRSRVILGDP